MLSRERTCRIGSGILRMREESAHLLQEDIFVPVAHPHSRTIHVLRHLPLLSQKPAPTSGHSALACFVAMTTRQLPVG